MAARLVPRFLVRFPAHSEAACKLLMELYDSPTGPQRQDGLLGPPGEARLLECTRRDALRGLGNVLEVAVRQAERNVPVVVELVRFLLRWG